MSKKEGGGAGSEVDALKAKLLATQMEMITHMDQVRRTQARSYEIELHINRISETSKEKIQSLEDIISLINSDAKIKDSRIHDLETDLAKLAEDSQENMKKMNIKMEEAKAEFEFKYESLELQLESAQIKLRELHEFDLRKQQLEKELQDTRTALLKEHESKIEMLAEAERASYAAQGKLLKQLETIVAETEARMTETIELQLTAKTKKTIIENKELKAEVLYHTKATLMLSKENERLIEEIHEFTRQVDSLKEYQDRLEQKVHMYLKTLRILVHKLREKEKQLGGIKPKKLSKMTPDERRDEEDFQELLIRVEHLEEGKRSSTAKRKSKGELGRSLRLIQKCAVEFLYACLEDMELDTFISVAEGEAETSEVSSDVPLDKLNMHQRHALLQSLLTRAAAVRVMSQSLLSAAPPRMSTRHQPYTPAINQPNPGGNIATDVQGVPEQLPAKDSIMANEHGNQSHEREQSLVKGQV